MLNLIDMLERVRVKRKTPPILSQIMHITSIFTLSFDEYNLLMFKGSYRMRYNSKREYKFIGVDMPFIPVPKTMFEFICDCNRYGVNIELNWDAFSDKDYGSFMFLHYD